MPPLIASGSPVTALLPKPTNSPLVLFSQCSSSGAISISRRNAVVLLSSLFTPTLIFQPPVASAFTFGISGPKEWLKEQKKKSVKFLLAPVDASRNALQYVYQLLVNNEKEFGVEELEQFQELLVSAARDCVPEDRNSFVEFQSNTGVEVCTFRLIVKNASSLLDDRDPIKLEAEDRLNDLIRSFASLNGMAREDIPLNSNRKRVANAIEDTILSLNMFEQGVKDCIETSPKANL